MQKEKSGAKYIRVSPIEGFCKIEGEIRLSGGGARSPRLETMDTQCRSAGSWGRLTCSNYCSCGISETTA